MVNLVSTVLHTLFPHVHETSPGKSAIFPSIYLLHLHRMLLDSLGLRFVLQPYPAYVRLYVVSIRQTGSLPPASFRFHLTVDTLALGYVLGTINPHSGLSPIRLRPCWAHNKTSIPIRNAR